MRYFRNVDIVNEFAVNEATVRKWVRDSKSGKLDLELYEQGARAYLADSLHNKNRIKELIETRRKFRNKKATKKFALEKRFMGVWRSDYTYQSSELHKEFLSQQYVRIYKKGPNIVAESVPGFGDSYMMARFSVDGNVITGSWQQVTDPKGAYKGIVYHGAAQLIISEDQKELKGKWVGFGKNMEVKTGPWKFTYIGEDETALGAQPKVVAQ